MKTKVFVLKSCNNDNIDTLQGLLDNGWVVTHATTQVICGPVYDISPIVYILTKEEK